MNLLAAIACFIKVVETGSIVGAAKNLGVSAPAVSQTINRLEEHLGARLLQRTTRSMALTENGALYFARVQRIASDLDSAQMAISTGETELQGRLCIAASSAFGRHVLAPLIAGFAERHPRLALELRTTDGISTSRTCEIGLSQHGGIDYHGLVYLVDRVTGAKAL